MKNETFQIFCVWKKWKCIRPPEVHLRTANSPVVGPLTWYVKNPDSGLCSLKPGSPIALVNALTTRLLTILESLSFSSLLRCFHWKQYISTTSLFQIGIFWQKKHCVEKFPTNQFVTVMFGAATRVEDAADTTCLTPGCAQQHHLA